MLYQHIYWLFIFCSVLSIILVFWLHRSLKQYDKSVNERTRINTFVGDPTYINQLATLNQSYQHSTQYNSFKSTIATIRLCTADNLQLCNTNDPVNSCKMCANNLYTVCLHFEHDTKFVNVHGKAFNIPKNKSSSEGYCLTASLKRPACNRIHGELILLESSDGQGAKFICSCKNPGYIGGKSCETPFICAGHVKNINVPLSKIECLCKPGTKFKRQNGVPTCVDSLFTDTGDLMNAKRLQDTLIKPVSKDILCEQLAINPQFSFQKINNPCSICPITGIRVDGDFIKSSGENDNANYECVSNWRTPWFGIPVRLHSNNNRLLRGKHGPDAVLAVHYKSVFMYGKLNEQERATYVIVFDYENGKNDRIFEALKLDKAKDYFIRSTNHEFVWPGSFGLTGQLFDSIPHFECLPLGVFYKCYFNPVYPIVNHGDRDEITYYGDRSNGMLYTDIQTNYTAQYKPVSNPPSFFIWGLSEWNEVKKFEKPFQFEPVKGREVLTQMVDQDVYRTFSSDISRRLKYLYAAINRDGKCLNFYLASNSDADNNWKTYLNHIYK